jgi:LPS sulfotransferase NodH
MKVEEIFDRIAEVRLLKKLSDRGNLLFVGEEETIKYLHNFFDRNNTNSHYDYYRWHENLNDFNYNCDSLSTYKAIIVASINNEHFIFDRLKQELEKFSLEIPILKLFSDLFVNVASDRPLLQVSDDKFITPKIAYAIASTARSGSTVLCKALTATQIAGFPEEHLRQPSQILTQNCHFDCVKYMRTLMTYQITENGVFGTKFISHFLPTRYQSDSNFKEILSQFNFIYIIRRDKIAQAASGYIAQKTKTWHIDTDERYKAYQASLNEINIEDADLEKLHSYYRWILEEERFWEAFFEKRQISPLVIEYEQFVESPERQVNKILKYLKIIDEDRVKVLNRYQYKLYQIAKKFKILGDDRAIAIKLKSKKLQSNLSKVLIQKYKEKYS